MIPTSKTVGHRAGKRITNTAFSYLINPLPFDYGEYPHRTMEQSFTYERLSPRDDIKIQKIWIVVEARLKFSLRLTSTLPAARKIRS